MLKILHAAQIHAADAHTIAHEPIASIDLMERASGVFARWFIEKFLDECDHFDCPEIKIFCGPGNNGGDGLAIARLLHENGFTPEVFVLNIGIENSADFQLNLKRLQQINYEIQYISNEADFPEIRKSSFIIDALFGSGLNKPLQGVAAVLIEYLNKADANRVAVDIPSGLFADKKSDGTIFLAHHTLSFELPKLAFLFPENEKYVGEFTFLTIGLDKKFIAQQETKNYLLERYDVEERFRKRKKFSHKGNYGSVLIIGGSYGKMGAVHLSAKAALKTGCGLATAYIPTCGYTAIQASLPEAMTLCDKETQHIADISFETKFDAVAIGMGLGTHPVTSEAFLNFLKKQTQPLLLDADALNILSQHKNKLKLIPQNSIITPHPKEFERLFGNTDNDFERHLLQLQKASELKIIIVLKGAHTIIAYPDGTSYFNATGNPGMATAGSGDVLSGIIVSLLAQGYTPKEAALMGVYIHGWAGNVASVTHSMTALTASNIIDSFSEVFVGLER